MKILFWFSVSLIAYAYCLYPVILFIFSKFGRITFHKSEGLPAVTLIVSAYNEESIIAGKIKNMLGLNYPRDRLEIIIASDGSDDRTNEIVRSFSDRGVVLADYDVRRGKAEVLNRTIQRAKNEIIVLSDANTFFKKDALKALVKNFGDEGVGCVCGEIKFKNALTNKMGELEGFYWKYEVFLKRLEGARGVLLGANGGIYAIRKRLFETIPCNTIVDDFVIPMKILENGYKVVYEPEAIAYEETAKNIIQEMARRVRIGAGDFQSLILTKRLLNPLRGFSAYTFWSHKVIRWFAPFLLTGALFFNAFLVGERFYFMMFIAQIGFYAVALIGRASSAATNIKVFGFCYYFVSMNIALLVGFFRFLTGTQAVTWNRTER
jgi:cellulose synthase/poly-beta-1,6-N-acetylglucosamine synthase-like glycosyltransferase